MIFLEVGRLENDSKNKTNQVIINVQKSFIFILYRKIIQKMQIWSEIDFCWARELCFEETFEVSVFHGHRLFPRQGKILLRRKAETKKFASKQNSRAPKKSISFQICTFSMKFSSGVNLVYCISTTSFTTNITNNIHQAQSKKENKF